MDGGGGYIGVSQLDGVEALTAGVYVGGLVGTGGQQGVGSRVQILGWTRG